MHGALGTTITPLCDGAPQFDMPSSPLVHLTLAAGLVGLGWERLGRVVKTQAAHPRPQVKGDTGPHNALGCEEPRTPVIGWYKGSALRMALHQASSMSPASQLMQGHPRAYISSDAGLLGPRV